jgi:hypothetical protein
MQIRQRNNIEVFSPPKSAISCKHIAPVVLKCAFALDGRARHFFTPIFWQVTAENEQPRPMCGLLMEKIK